MIKGFIIKVDGSGGKHKRQLQVWSTLTDWSGDTSIWKVLCQQRDISDVKGQTGGLMQLHRFSTSQQIWRSNICLMWCSNYGTLTTGGTWTPFSSEIQLTLVLG